MTAQLEGKRRHAVLKEAARWIAKIDAKDKLGGPKTQAGKRISSENSRKHGVTSRDVERRFDASLEVPEWLFAVRDQLRMIADESDPMDALLIRKALIAAWRVDLAEQALDMELATSAYPVVDINKTHTGWASDAEHGLSGGGAGVTTKGAKKQAYYAARFRSERDNAIRQLQKRYVSRTPGI